MTQTGGPVPGEPAARMKNAWILLTAMCLLVIGGYAYTAHSGVFESLSPNAADTYYNLLVQGFQAGQLSVKREVPPGLVQLPDPYDPSTTAIYRYAIPRIHDMSYYKGRLYLYFGITPALILFWPFFALTGHYLFHREAVIIFCSIGFLASVYLLREIWRRYFLEVNVGVIAGCVLALGLATGVPIILSRSEVYEVATSCGGMLTMLTLLAIWRALNETEQKCRWLALASLAYGLALGARPSLLFGAVILLVPVAQTWRERKQIWTLLLAAICPIAFIGLGLMLYNFLRFDNPFEFGAHYQLVADREVTKHLLSLRYFWFNFRYFFLEPAQWTYHFPFVREIALLPSAPSDAEIEAAFGILTSIPLVWLALGIPLACRGRSVHERSVLRWFLAAAGLFFAICALTSCLFPAAVVRYEVEFLPTLILMAAIGTLGLDRALVNRPAWRWVVRGGCALLLCLSAAFNVFASFDHYAGTENSLGVAYGQAGRLQEAIAPFKEAVRVDPDYADAHYNLGMALWQSGQKEEAIAQYEEVALLKPQDAEIVFNLGMALAQVGRMKEAIANWERALQINPDHAEAHYNLGIALVRQGRVQEAMTHWRETVRINPNHTQAHYNLGIALEQAGNAQEAAKQYEQALRLRPDFTAASNALARLRVTPTNR